MIAIGCLLFIFQCIYTAYYIKKNNSLVFLNIFFFINILSTFYITLPSLFALSTNLSMVGASQDTIQYTSIYGLYYSFICTLFFLFSTFIKNKNNFHHTVNMKGDKLSFILKLISAILFIITLAIIISNLGNILSVFGNRPKQSLLNEYLQNVFKLNTIFYILVLIITYLTLRFNNLKYIFIFAPFLFLDLLLFGKLYILFIIVIYCICSAILRRKMHFKYIYFSILLLASFTVLRTYLRVGYFEISFMTQMLGEFLNTWEVGYLIQSSTKEQDFLYTLGFFFLRALPSPYISIFFDDYISYTAISTAINPLDYGLAGNLIAESLAFKSNFLLIVAPILFCCFFFIISFLPSLGFISTNQLYILYCIQLLPIFRYSFYELALYPIYLITTFGFLFIFIDLAKKNAK